MIDPSPATSRMVDNTRINGADRSAITQIAWIGLVLLLVSIVFGMLTGLSKRATLLIYLFNCYLTPLLAALVLRGARNSSGRLRLTLEYLSVVAKAFAIFLLASVLGIAVRLYLIAPSVLHERTPLRLAILSGGAAVVFAVFVVYGSTLRRSASRGLAALGEACERLKRPWWFVDVLVVGLLAAICIVYSPFMATRRMPSTILDYAYNTSYFLWWMALGVGYVLATNWLRRIEDSSVNQKKAWIDWLSLITIAAFVLMLFDDSLYLDLGHYMPYVGPALHAKHGGTPMVDVFSQYGLLPWMLIEWAFEVLPTTFGSAALLTRIVNLAYLFTIAAIIFVLSRHRVSAMLLTIPVLIVGITFHDGNYNMNSLPSTTGMRYLVPALMALVLTTAQAGRRIGLIALPILVVASFWSLETFVFTLVPWIAVASIQCLRQRALGDAGKSVLWGVTAIIAAHVLAGAAVFTSTGQWLKYRPYFDFFTRFRPDEIRDWAVPFNPNFALWIPVWLVFFLIVAWSTYNAIRRRPAPDAADRLLPVATFGIASLLYFVGRTSPTTLGLSLLPFAVVMVIVAEGIFLQWRRLGANGVVAGLVLGGMGSYMVAFGAERFAREPLPDQGNSTLLRRCVSAAGCDFRGVGEQLSIKVRALPFAPDSPAIQASQPKNHEREQVQEIVSQLRRFAANKDRVGILGPMNSYGGYMGISALMETGQWYLWGISSPHNDELSPAALDRIVQAAAKTKEGEVIVVARDAELPFLEQEILRVIRQRCRLVPLEDGKFYSALRTDHCALPQ